MPGQRGPARWIPRYLPGYCPAAARPGHSAGQAGIPLDAAEGSRRRRHVRGRSRKATIRLRKATKGGAAVRPFARNGIGSRRQPFLAGVRLSVGGVVIRLCLFREFLSLLLSNS